MWGSYYLKRPFRDFFYIFTFFPGFSSKSKLSESLKLDETGMALVHKGPATVPALSSVSKGGACRIGRRPTFVKSPFGRFMSNPETLERAGLGTSIDGGGVAEGFLEDFGCQKSFKHKVIGSRKHHIRDFLPRGAHEKNRNH